MSETPAPPPQQPPTPQQPLTPQQPPASSQPSGPPPAGGYQQPPGGYPPGPGGYPYPPYHAPPPYNTYAILALILALVVLPPLGIYFGSVAKKQIAVSGERGIELANVAVIVGWILTAIFGLFFVVWCGFFGVFLGGMGGMGGLSFV